jgi:hypothetical protein
MLKWALRKTAPAFYKDKQFLELRMHWIAGRIASGSEFITKDYHKASYVGKEFL